MDRPAARVEQRQFGVGVVGDVVAGVGVVELRPAAGEPQAQLGDAPRRDAGRRPDPGDLGRGPGEVLGIEQPPERLPLVEERVAGREDAPRLAREGRPRGASSR